MSWLAFQIAATVLLSVNSIMDKRLVRDHAQNPALYLASFAVVGLPATLIGCWLVPWRGVKVVSIGLAAGLTYAGAIWLYYRAMNLAEVSRLASVLRMSTVFKLILVSVFLDDHLTLRLYSALVFMMMGTFAISWTKNGPTSASAATQRRGIWLMMLAAFLLAISGTLSSYIVLSYLPWDNMVWTNAGIVLALFLLLLIPAQRISLHQAAASTSFRLRTVLMGEQLGRLIVSILTDWAIYLGKSVAITTFVSELRPLLVLIMAVIFLDEKISKQDIFPKLGGISLMGIGGLLLL
ncbi:MAG: hypothetical protein Fur0021_12030 [Candidatus Promineifilaceae bacterium]